MGPLGYVLKHYEPARFLWGFLVFLPCVFCAILFGMLGQLALSIRCWHAFCFGNGVTNRVHGALPPAGEPAIWVANHFNWFDWPLLQALLPYTLHAIVKADIGGEVVVGRIMGPLCKHSGAIFHSRGDRASGTSIRSKLQGHPGSVLVFPEGTTQAYGPPMVEKMRNGGFEAAFEAGKLVQPAAIYYSRRVGLGWEREANGLRQVANLCQGPTVAAVQLCPPLRPRDFASAEALAKAAKTALCEAYAALEARYKEWPVEHLGAGAPA